MFTKIIFKPMRLEDNIEIVKWAYFQDNDLLDIHNYTIKCFNELSGLEELSKEEINDKIEDVVTRIYNHNLARINDDVEKYNRIWKSYNDLFFDRLYKYLDINPNINVINADVGIIPVFPRDLDSLSFSVSVGLAENDIVDTCAHESLHFLWFEKWRQLFPSCLREEFDSPYLPWQYSEMVVDPILNNPEFKSILGVDFKSYDSFYLDSDIMSCLKDIYNEYISIDEKIIKGYECVLHNLKK